MHLSRILMSAVGANGAPAGGQSGTGQPSGSPPPPAGSAPAPAGAPAGTAPSAAPTPQAQGASPLSPDAIKAIADQVGNVVKDGVFADLRRAGVLGKAPQPKPNASADSGTPAPAGAPAYDPMRMRELDRAIARAGLSEQIDGTAYKRIERSFAEELPDNTEAWVADYFRGLGVRTGALQQSQQPQPQNGAAAPQQTPNAHPASDRGSPPPPKTPADEVDLVKMSQADREALVREKGAKWYHDTLMNQLKGRRVLLR